MIWNIFSKNQNRLLHKKENDEDEERKSKKKSSDTKKKKDGEFLLEKSMFEIRTVLVAGDINDKLASNTTKQLLVMANQSSDPITVIVSSPGGHVESGDMIHDMIQFVSKKALVRVLGTGWVASAGALIFVAPPKKQRFCLANTRFLLHEPRGGIGGTASDIDIQAKEILRMRARLNQIFSEATGQKLERIEQDTYRDYWMNAQEAKEYGVVSHIIHSISELR